MRRAVDDLRRADLELERKSRECSQAFRGAKSEEVRKECEASLRSILDKQFAVRLDIRELEIHNLEERIEELREEFEQRRKQKDRLISRRVEDLTGQARSRQW